MNDYEYEFDWGKGLVKFNSLSPNGRYFYQIKTPPDLSWGLFAAKIAFLTCNGHLIYYNAMYADPIHDKMTDTIRYASYSRIGDLVYFRERKNLKLLFHIILDLEKGKFKKVAWTNSDNVQILEDGDFTEEDLGLFSIVEWQKGIKRIKLNRNFFAKKIWFPSGV